MPNIVPIANVVVLVAAGVGAILAVLCFVQIVRHRRPGGNDSRLTYRQHG